MTWLKMRYESVKLALRQYFVGRRTQKTDRMLWNRLALMLTLLYYNPLPYFDPPQYS
jgi:hypothetical protein